MCKKIWNPVLSSSKINRWVILNFVSFNHFIQQIFKVRPMLQSPWQNMVCIKAGVIQSHDCRNVFYIHSSKGFILFAIRDLYFLWPIAHPLFLHVYGCMWMSLKMFFVQEKVIKIMFTSIIIYIKDWQDRITWRRIKSSAFWVHST